MTDLIPYLPPFSAAIFQIDLYAAFNRKLFAAQNKTLAWAYSDPIFLSRFQPSIADATERYQDALFKLGASIKARTFGPDGLWNGQPFVWRGVDPTVVPWFFAI